MDYSQALEYGDFDAIPLLDQKRVLWEQLWPIIRFNAAWLKVNPGAPWLYASGVVFVREPDLSLNRWTSIPLVLRRGHSHCVGLSCWRIAELIVRQKNRARPVIQLFKEQRPSGWMTEFHVTVLLENEDHEDPSRKLGMP